VLSYSFLHALSSRILSLSQATLSSTSSNSIPSSFCSHLQVQERVLSCRSTCLKQDGRPTVVASESLSREGKIRSTLCCREGLGAHCLLEQGGRHLGSSTCGGGGGKCARRRGEHGPRLSLHDSTHSTYCRSATISASSRSPLPIPSSSTSPTACSSARSSWTRCSLGESFSSLSRALS
jgi:hypothetical protein